jgi:hypothetical protein
MVVVHTLCFVEAGAYINVLVYLQYIKREYQVAQFSNVRLFRFTMAFPIKWFFAISFSVSTYTNGWYSLKLQDDEGYYQKQDRQNDTYYRRCYINCGKYL